MRPPFDFSSPCCATGAWDATTHVPASEHLDKVLGKQNNARLRASAAREKRYRAIKETEAAGAIAIIKEAILLRNNNC